jgi:ribonuclease HI
MSDERLYVPPPIRDPSPPCVISTRNGAHFSNLFQLRSSRLVKSRDIAIIIDGACAGNGTQNARAAMGVYFGPDSRYNLARLLVGGPQTSQRAELNAAILALKRVRTLVNNGRLSTGMVVLVSDSRYVVGSMTEWVYKWRNNGWENVRGLPVTNQADFQELDDLIDELDDTFNIQVKFWRVGRCYTQEADDLAKQRLNAY